MHVNSPLLSREDRAREPRYNGSMRMTLAFPFLLLLVTLSACTGLKIPPPDAPVTPQPEPPIETSILSIPVTLSLDNILSDLGFEGSRDRIGGSVRRFLKKQALKNETRLVQNKFVRQQLDRVWSSVQKPILLENGLSLHLNPEALSVSTLSDQEENITLVLGIRARPRITAAGAAFVPRALPEISIAPPPQERGFHISLESELPFEQLSREMTDQLKGTILSGKDGTVTIEKVRVYGSGRSLVAAVDVKGSANGTVYLYGTPVYDPATRSLALRDADYTLETREVLSRSADWLLHTGMQEKLVRRAVWSIGDKIDAARESMSSALNKQVYDQVRISGRITDLRPVSVGLTLTGIRAVLQADGNVDVKVQ